MDLPYWLRFAETFGTVATPVLIVIGGAFAWFKFFRQGEHDSRIQPSLEIELIRTEPKTRVIVKVGAANTGQVDVFLDLESSGLSVLFKGNGEGWVDGNIAYNVFLEQEKVQPGATVLYEVLAEFDLGESYAVCLELTVAEKVPENEQREPETWKTFKIISLDKVAQDR